MKNEKYKLKKGITPALKPARRSGGGVKNHPTYFELRESSL